MIGQTAGVQIRLGLKQAAARSLEKALLLSDQSEEYFFRAELLRLQASLNGAPANEALALAKRQNAIAWIERINAYHDSLQH